MYCHVYIYQIIRLSVLGTRFVLESTKSSILHKIKVIHFNQNVFIFYIVFIIEDEIDYVINTVILVYRFYLITILKV